MSFERFPDELVLEICQYLSSTDVLYALYNLNSRLNRTIFNYRQHVVLRRTSFIQFEYLCSNVLPAIGSTIRSLSINANWTDLLAKRFHFYFGDKMKILFPNLEHLILVAFSGDELYDYMESISDLPYLTKLTIHDRYNVTDEYKQILFDKVLSANNNRLEKIFFNRHSESLSINEMSTSIYSNITQLSIHLEKIDDLRYLFKLIPNIQELFIVINKHFEDNIIEFDILIMAKLIEFHIESFRRSWIFSEIHSLLNQMPFLERLSLDLFTQDFHLLQGDQLCSILPKNNLKSFSYAIDYTPEDTIDSIDVIESSWASAPYSICYFVEETKSHLFLHTIPYGFSYLDMSSSFVKYMNKSSTEYNYSIKELVLFNISTLAKTFIGISKCRKIKDLALEVEDTVSISEDKDENKINVSLPSLNQLHWLSIDGCPLDGSLIKEILFAAPNLCMLILDMKLVLQLIETNDPSCMSILKSRIRHLSVEMSDESQLNDINIERLSTMFTSVRFLIIETKAVNGVSIENILSLFLNYFQKHKLMSIIIRGSTTEQLRSDPTQWLIDHTYLNKQINEFKAECDNVECKIWL